MEKLKNKKVIIPIVLLVLLIALGLTYAWFVWTDNGKQTVKIKGGSLALRLDESSGNGIRLIRSIPMSDEQGLATTAYTFSVENRGSMNAKYSLSLEDLDLDSENGENARMNDSNIRYSINRNSEGEKPIALDTRIIKKGVILKAGETDTYTLKIWIQSEATKEIAEQVFKTRIKLDAVETEKGTEKNSNILKVYNYDQDNTETKCILGTESSCIEKQYIDVNTRYNVGDIVEYQVNDEETKLFNVLYDQGDTLLLQQTRYTTGTVAWCSKEDFIAAGGTEEEYGTNGNNTKGPITALNTLEAATQGWTNVNDMTYQMGTTEFGTGKYKTSKTAIDYPGFVYPSIGLYPDFDWSTLSNQYTLAERTAKARMITFQEALELKCGASRDCKILFADEFPDGAYWTMSAVGNVSEVEIPSAHTYDYGLMIFGGPGGVINFSTSVGTFGATKAVVEINK